MSTHMSSKYINTNGPRHNDVKNTSLLTGSGVECMIKKMAISVAADPTCKISGTKSFRNTFVKAVFVQIIDRIPSVH